MKKQRRFDDQQQVNKIIAPAPYKKKIYVVLSNGSLDIKMSIYAPYAPMIQNRENIKKNGVTLSSMGCNNY